MPLFVSILSHDPPAGRVVAIADQGIDPCPVFSIPKFCGSGEPPCATAVNVSPLCDSKALGPVPTIASVTLTAMLCPVVALVTLIDPLYVPAVREPGIAVTVRSVGFAAVAVPLGGET